MYRTVFLFLASFSFLTGCIPVREQYATEYNQQIYSPGYYQRYHYQQQPIYIIQHRGHHGHRHHGHGHHGHHGHRRH